MKSEKDRNRPERSDFEKEVRNKIREILGDLHLEDAKKTEIVETWLYQKFTHIAEEETQGGPETHDLFSAPRPVVKPHDAKAMSRRKIPLNYHPVFSEEETKKIGRGFLPLSLEDKWLICLEEGELCIFRNQTKVCTYELHLEKTPKGCRVREAWVDPDFIEQNEWNSPLYAERLLEYIIHRLLLGRLVKFPFPPRMRKPAERSMLQLGLMGSNLATDEHAS